MRPAPITERARWSVAGAVRGRLNPMRPRATSPARVFTQPATGGSRTSRFVTVREQGTVRATQAARWSSAELWR
jgi:hypothetical protein